MKLPSSLLQSLRAASTVTLSVWFLAVSVIGSSLLARHLLPFALTDEVAVSHELVTLRTANERGSLLGAHVLYAECRCSRRIAESLVATKRPDGVAEHVIIVGHDPSLWALFEGSRFTVHEETAETLAAQYHVTSAPLFFLADAQDRALYVGGYTERKQGPHPRDRDIIEAALAGRHTSALPIYGCAVAENIRNERKLSRAQ